MATPETTLFDRLAGGFTPKGLDAIQANPPAGKVYRADPAFPGLLATFYPTGAVIFSWKASDRRTVSCGKYRITATLAEAREHVEKLRSAQEAGTLNAAIAEVEAALQPKREAPLAAGKTVEEVWREFFQLRIEPKRDTADNVALMWKTDLSALGAMPVLAVRTEDCVKVIKRMTTGSGRPGGKAAARATAVLQVMKQFFAWARRNAHLTRPDGVKQEDPAADLKGEDLGCVARRRKRALSAVEIPVFWRGLAATREKAGKLQRGENHRVHGLDERTITALRFLLLVPERSGELLQATRREFDLDAGVWTVPAEHTKTKEAFVIDLPPLAVQLVRRLFALGGKSHYALAGADGKPYSEKALSHAMRSRFAGKAPLVALPGCPETGSEAPTPHTLRHTFATRAADAGIDGFVADRCLAHAIPGVAGIYNAGNYRPQRKEALLKWAAYVSGLVGIEQAAAAPALRLVS